ncbi:hypothetical protein HYX70_00390 [Candidatus Saccharibacteria bacterium]|nr:hypothetical protein [Candidatus Saccharibacteria bacterium]
METAEVTLRSIAEGILQSSLTGHFPMDPEGAAQAVAKWSDEEVAAFCFPFLLKEKKWDFETGDDPLSLLPQELEEEARELKGKGIGSSAGS